jgi:AcrR family transcriptional regulator
MQKRVIKTRERLLEAAERLFLEKGVDLTTVDEITDSADLGKGTFYRHFQNKEEVLRILMRNAVDRLATRIREGIGKPANLQ